MSFEGKKALVTGASQGIGRVIAKTLAAEGAEVIVNCAHSPAKAQAVADEIIADGGKASVFVCDVSDEAAVKQMFARLSPIHYLINNARVDPYFRKPEMSNGDWFSLVMDINLKGAYLCSMSFFEQAKLLAGSCIVNISSVRAFTPAEMHMIAYNVSKLGMHGLTRAFAANGAPYKIRANTVCPGMVLTENMMKRLTPEQAAAEASKIALGRPAESEEIAAAVVYALKNEYVTGDTLQVNGGMYYAP